MERNFETLLTSRPTPSVLLVMLNRVKVSNAFNTLMAREMFEIFENLTPDAAGIRCMVVTGAGEEAFCAGGDLKERNGMSDETWRLQHPVFERMIRAVIDCPLPTIGAVNGAAYGGGCEIAAALDFLYAAEHARFALPETTLGIIPGIGGTQTLSRAIGGRRAKEVILAGKPFSALQARDWGLVNALFPSNKLLDATLDTAQRIAANAPIAVRQAKQAIHHGLNMSLTDGLAFEVEAYNRTIPTEDRREGVLAFNEKRKPYFKGN